MRRKALLEESEEWDEAPLERVLEESERVSARIIDRRKPKKAISLRVDPDLITATKKIAAEWGIGYQTLFRYWLLTGFSRYVGSRREPELDEIESVVRES